LEMFLQIILSHSCIFAHRENRGLYIGKYPPPHGEKYQPISFGVKNIKRPREKEENVEEKGRGKKMRKGEVKG
jgi:hypothetical protein